VSYSVLQAQSTFGVLIYVLRSLRFLYIQSLFRSTLMSRPKKWVSNICPYVRPSTKRFFDFNEIWRVRRG